MSKLASFLRPCPAGKTKEVILERFTDEEGKPVPFIVQSITPEENEELSRISTDEKGNLNSFEYGNRLIVACIVEPNLKDKELCKYYGVLDPIEVPGIMFTIGEKQVIQEAIMNINDLTLTSKKLQKAKNF